MQLLGYDSDTVLPTVIITDQGGRILWAHETDNYLDLGRLIGTGIDVPVVFIENQLVIRGPFQICT